MLGSCTLCYLVLHEAVASLLGYVERQRERELTATAESVNVFVFTDMSFFYAVAA